MFQVVDETIVVRYDSSFGRTIAHPSRVEEREGHKANLRTIRPILSAEFYQSIHRTHDVLRQASHKWRLSGGWCSCLAVWVNSLTW